ncbi:xanthine dehydrogenase subunit D [Cohnella sp. CFH 77786]|uniref:xanthine dehydrogenase subunit D n=1 Tax=Cohnella sp. CFH 77786 TaxID=2662265 RepID=UPI001C6090B3|nr:xanthine dehydrogenase subunit D [Cohnella sp. CFH 77786]MBW5448533.1 xanthine dehydrogenase subunit D [Cohnella sp. CFH 77786]
MLLDRQGSGRRWRIRPDGPGKVTGGLAYLTDMAAPGMLIGLVLRSPHPHALILDIRTENAKRVPGVRAVLTHEDVPGLNAFGIARQDQPVFCFDRVRYVGDAVAAVAADTLEAAERALSLIEVDYAEQPVLDSPEKALAEGAPLLHPCGNELHRTDYRLGDPEQWFKACTVIVEETYVTPRQMHTYMETEGGLFVPEPDGRLTVYSPTQHGFMDRLQLSRVLGRPQSDIRVVSSPIGGSFGGKDELNVQPYGALLALAAGKPVKIHNSRKESVRAGLKRHPMVISMKTGADAEGRILAHRVKIVADTGPYATLGAEVLNFATEHVIGPYRIPNVDVDSVSVYTNNGMSGEFRGFGGNQAIFALEGQIDRIAGRLGIDPWELRRRNMRQPDDPGPLGQPIAPTEGAAQVWQALAESPLWRERSQGVPEDDREREHWIKTGIGAAYIMHGAGLGVGIPDPAGGRLVLAEDGKIEAVFGYEEFGQGLIATLELMMMETFGFEAEDVRIVIGDTDVVPDSGSSTASRATSMLWKSVQNMKGPFTESLLSAAADLTGNPADQLRLGPGGVYAMPEPDAASGNDAGSMLLSYAELASRTTEPIRAETAFHFPTTSSKRIGAHFLYTYSAVAAKVEVDTLTGRVRLLDQYHAVAAGPVMNPQGYLGQIEGGSSMALGWTLTEEALMAGGRYLTNNLDTYLIPTVAEHAGNVAVRPIEELPEGDAYGPRGIGEIGSVGLAPAIAAAVRDAVGVWVRKLPIDPRELQDIPHFARKAVLQHDR